MVDEISRLLAGAKLYVAPSRDYVLFIYPPLYPLEHPPGTSPILVLRDSFGVRPRTPVEETFPKVLERRLDGRSGKVEVINTGVTASYSPYNERQWWLARGRELHPDLVIVSFCLNDVVNPCSTGAARPQRARPARRGGARCLRPQAGRNGLALNARRRGAQRLRLTPPSTKSVWPVT